MNLNYLNPTLTAYWLCITNEANWVVTREKNVCGVPERHKNTIAKVKLGDRFLIYVKQENAKGGVNPLENCMCL